jgi:hydrogenase maturation protease
MITAPSHTMKQLVCHPDTLLIAIGNSARGDDGLGWALLDALQEKEDFRGGGQARYQLNVEDAELLQNHPVVLFADATVEDLPQGILLERVQPTNDLTFTTHALSPGAVLFLCEELYGHRPEAWVLKMQGYQWELGDGLSREAMDNLERAIALF